MKGKTVTLRPLDDKVVVRQDDAEKMTPGGIVLPDAAAEKPARGKVTAIGLGRLLDNGERSQMQVNEGDTILFARYGGADVEIDGTKFKILSERDILAVVE